jgi:antitoxin ParD1/3/4
MPSAEKRTVSLPVEQADYIDSLVASGAYATASEVVRAGLREEVVPVAAAMQDDPGRAIPAGEVFAEIRALHAKRSRTP